MKKLATAIWIVAYILTIIAGLGWGVIWLMLHLPWVLGGLLVGFFLTLIVTAVYGELP